MLRDIYDFATANHLEPQRNRKDRKIAAYVCLSSEGSYRGLEIFEKKEIREVSCPDIGTYGSQAKYCQPIAEKKGFIFPDSPQRKQHSGGDAEEKKESGVSQKHLAWLSIMSDGAKHVPILQTVYLFLSKLEEDDGLRDKVRAELSEEKIKDTEFISFKIGNRYLLEDESWKQWFHDYVDEHYSKKEDEIYLISSITGHRVASIPEKGAPMVSAAVTGTGAYPIAIGEPAFESYGMSKNIGARVGYYEDEVVATGLQYLLKDGRNFNRNFGLIHWYDCEVPVDLIAASIDSEKDELLEGILHMMETGQGVNNKKLNHAKYFLFDFHVPTKGRMYLCHKRMGLYDELRKNLIQWYRDTRISCPKYDKEKKEYIIVDSNIKKIYQVYLGLLDKSLDRIREMPVSDQWKAIDHEYGDAKTALLDSIYFGRQLPKIYFRKALERFTKDRVIGAKEGPDEKKRPKINYIALQIISVFQKRNGGGMDKELHSGQSKAYACGRLFAAYERVQLAANEWKEPGTGLSVRYFSAVQKQPGLILGELANLSMAHLNKIKNSNKTGERTYFFLKNQIAEIASEIGESFPKQMDDEERGQFILGYYAQYLEYKTKKNKEKFETEEGTYKED